MRDSIFFKFLALCLCPLMLLVSIASALGILAFATIGLEKDQTPEDAYRAQVESRAVWIGQEAAARYFSKKLGGLPEVPANMMYSTVAIQNSYFRADQLFYTLKDADGNALESNYSGQEYKDKYVFSEPVSQYTQVLEEEPQFADNCYEFGYYDNGDVLLYLRSCTGPAYSVEIYLGPGAVREDPMWTILIMAWNYRYYLFAALGVSLLLFAALAAYLCVAAGRRPGSKEVVPAGLNCLPLDLYAAVCVGITALIVFLGAEGLDYLLNVQGISVVTAALAYSGYACCLLFVGFCYACAAQFKAPGAYWWHHSVVGFCWRIFARAFGWCWKLFVRMMKGLPWLFRGGCRVIKAITLWSLVQIDKTWKSFYWFMRRGVRWFGRNLNRVYSLLPLSWQWLLVGFGMVVVLFITIVEREYLLGLVLCGIVIFYGASVFGTLLDSVRKMRSGNLETKINDNLMAGAFRQFAEELNGLADVAVVAAQKQLKSERMKTELITNVSHDIKTPLTSIINYVDLLQKPHTPEEEATYLEVLSRQSQRMKKLIDDLMEMSKASTGNMPVEITRMDAAETVNQCLGEFSDKLTAASLTPVFYPPEEAVPMFADGRLVWRCMSNLLSNAVKYALPGTRLYVDLTRAEGKVMVSVKNISREPLNISADELLERFVRGDTARNTEGSGLGLNIAKSLMELQHGELQLLVDGDLFKATLVFPAAG